MSLFQPPRPIVRGRRILVSNPTFQILIPPDVLLSDVAELLIANITAFIARGCPWCCFPLNDAYDMPREDEA